jgi:putative glutamine amidotransferase
MKKPFIGIPTRYHEKSEYVGQLRYYLDAILWAGGLPLMIPLNTDAEIIRAYAERIDGILLPGSPTDIDPKRFGAQPHPKLGRLYPEREITDFTLLDYSEQNNKPVLGICFGVQSLNVYRGGSLVQDIPAIVSGSVAHDNDERSECKPDRAQPVNDDDAADHPKDPARHLVRVSEGSLIAKLAGKTEVEVNSYHHQSVQDPGRNLKITAVAPDGVVEALEDTQGRFVVGVQWHPERGFQNDPLSQALFRSLIQAAML